VDVAVVDFRTIEVEVAVLVARAVGVALPVLTPFGVAVLVLNACGVAVAVVSPLGVAVGVDATGPKVTVVVALMFFEVPETLWLPELAAFGTENELRKLPAASVCPLISTEESKYTVIAAIFGKPWATTPILWPPEVVERVAAIVVDSGGEDALSTAGRPMPTIRASKVTATTMLGRRVAMN
jgi:hypothetical protein